MTTTTTHREPEERHPCSRPGCRNLVEDRWEPTGRLCASCALEVFLFDRDARWDDDEAAAAVTRAVGAADRRGVLAAA